MSSISNNLFHNLMDDNIDTIELQEYTNEDYKRKLRSLTQRILLIDTSVIYNGEQISNIDEISGLDFKVLGSTSKIYMVQVWRELYNINCSKIYLI